MKIITLDPGKKNFAAAVVEDRKILETRFLHPMQSLLWDDFDNEAKTFRDEYYAFVSSVKPDCVLAERFMARPGSRKGAGAVGEYVNIMLGIIAVVNSSMGIPTHLVTPAQWKNTLNRRYGKMSDKGMKDHFQHLTTHEADAVGIALYVLEDEFPEEKGKLLGRLKRQKKYPYAGKIPRFKKKVSKKSKKTLK